MGPTHPTILWALEFILGVKRSQQRDGDHASLSIAQVKKKRSYTVSPSIRLHDLESGNFPLTFSLHTP